MVGVDHLISFERYADQGWLDTRRLISVADPTFTLIQRGNLKIWDHEGGEHVRHCLRKGIKPKNDWPWHTRQISQGDQSQFHFEPKCLISLDGATKLSMFSRLTRGCGEIKGGYGNRKWKTARRPHNTEKAWVLTGKCQVGVPLFPPPPPPWLNPTIYQ